MPELTIQPEVLWLHNKRHCMISGEGIGERVAERALERAAERAGERALERTGEGLY